MKIAVIGWGSLIWSERTLAVEPGEWKNDGPRIPIEFSRISTDNRLTLVIDRHFDEVQTYWKLSVLNDLEDACENLRIREDTPDMADVGFIDLENRMHRIRPTHMFLLGKLAKWGVENELDAMIWTGLEPKFEEKTGSAFSIENIGQFISTLNSSEYKRAREYIENAPEQTRTRLRSKIMEFFT